MNQDIIQDHDSDQEQENEHQQRCSFTMIKFDPLSILRQAGLAN